MSLVEVQLVLTGPEDAGKVLKKLQKGLLNFKKPFDRTIIYMHKSFADSFKRGGRGGSKWKANKPWTKQIKKGARILQDKGFLRSSLTGVTNKSFKRQSARRLEIGTTVKYAVVQERGKKIRVSNSMRTYFAANHSLFIKADTTSITIPKRPFMFFQKKDIKQITFIFNTWMQQEIDALA